MTFLNGKESGKNIILLSSFLGDIESVKKMMEQEVTGDITDELSEAVYIHDPNEGDIFVQRGVAEIGKKASSISAESAYRIGSTTKTFVAATAVMLAKEGKLDLDSNLHKHVETWAKKLKEKYPDIENVDDFEKIIKNKTHPDATLKNLMNHTSGIRSKHRENSLGGEGGFSYMAYDEKTDITERGKAEYSNVGYLILGQIMEVETGRDIEEIVEKEVVEKYNLENTFFAGGERKAIGATTYFLNPENKNLYEHLNLKSDGACGGIVSTPRDLAKFFHIIATDETFEQMQSITNQTHNSYGDFLSGLFRIKYDGKEYIGHTGGRMDGVGSAVFVDIETGRTVALTSSGVAGLEEAIGEEKYAELKNAKIKTTDVSKENFYDEINNILKTQAVAKDNLNQINLGGTSISDNDTNIIPDVKQKDKEHSVP